jgi:hypothetical protein
MSASGDYLDSQADKHYREWVEGSAVDPDLTTLNLKSLSGNAPYDYLLYSPKLARTNTGRLSFSILNRYKHLDDGGWWCSGINVLTGEDSLWGCFKPNNPKFDEEKQKHRKYEHPEKVPTEVFALKISVAIFQLIARRYDVALPEDYKNVTEDAWIFWKWVIEHPQIPLVVSEGAKKAAALLSCGYAAIALPGIWNGIKCQPSQEEHTSLASLIPQMQVFAQKDRRIYFAFDQDIKPKTLQNVNAAIAKTAKLFAYQGCTPKIIVWNSLLAKGVDDLIVACGRETFDKLYCDALDFDEWQSMQLRELTYAPDVVIDRRYIGEELPPADAQLICIKSPKGTGKTEWLRWLTDPQVRSGERRTLLIVHRIQLGIQTSNRLDIPFISEVKTVDQGAHFGYALCIDSLHALSQARFNPQEWRGAWVILDEIQQVIWHLLSSSTCQKDRVSIVKTLQELLRVVVSTGGKIIIADADLNDISIDFVEGLLGYLPKRFILLNQYKFNEPWTVYKFGGKDPSQLVAQLEKRLRNGEKALLCVSGQRAKSRWGTQVQEEYFRRKFPGIKILRIDSETVANPDHEACGCTQDLNKIITNYQLVICSPTVETGVSIHVQHFDGVWCISQGVQTTDGTRQHLSRVRPPVPRYVWLKPIGINFIGNGANTASGLISSQNRLDKVNRDRLLQSGLENLPDGSFSHIPLQTWAKLGATINMGMWKYEKTVLKDLQAEGHHIVNWQDREQEEENNTLSPDTVKKEVDQVRDEVYLKYREDVTAAEKLSDIQYEKLNKQQQKRTSEILQLKKGQIERKYLIDCNPKLIEKDDKKWHGKLKLHYLWTVGREYLTFKDSQLIDKAIVNGGGDYFVVDSNRTLMQLKVGLLDYLGIFQLYEDSGFHNQHSVIKTIVDKVKSQMQNIKLVGGIDLRKLVKDDKNNIAVVQQILSSIGHKMVCYERKGGRGNQIRYYSAPAPSFAKHEGTKKPLLDDRGLPIPESDGRESVFEAWLERDAEALRKWQEEKVLAQKQAEEAMEVLRRGEAAREAREAREQELLAGLTEMLNLIENQEMLDDVRERYPSDLLKVAARGLCSEQRDRLRQLLTAS